MGGQVAPGDRIELVRCSDEWTLVAPGTRGTVTFVDDAGTVHARWDDGSQLGLIPGVDEFLVVRPLGAGEIVVHAYAGSGDRGRCTVHCLELTDGAMTVRVNGRACGEVHRGINDEWYWVPLGRIGHAYPLQGSDNVAGTGAASPDEAALAGLDLRRAG